MKLFGWTHMLGPNSGVDFGDKPWMRQTTCFVVLKTNREFMERFGYKAHNFKDWVQVEKIADGQEPPNEGARLAIENPGVAYGQDTWNHTPGENVWVEILS